MPAWVAARSGAAILLLLLLLLLLALAQVSGIHYAVPYHGIQQCAPA